MIRKIITIDPLIFASLERIAAAASIPLSSVIREALYRIVSEGLDSLRAPTWPAMLRKEPMIRRSADGKLCIVDEHGLIEREM